eukprot:1178004-Pleurochrysis_carterae.AAC.1
MANSQRTAKAALLRLSNVLHAFLLGLVLRQQGTTRKVHLFVCGLLRDALPAPTPKLTLACPCKAVLHAQNRKSVEVPATACDTGQAIF